MTKIVQLFSLQNNLPLFSAQEIIQDIKEHYSKSDLGKIDIALPWDKIRQLIKPHRNKKGPLPHLSIETQIALMILKSYTGLSDKKLAERINTDTYHRIFCRSTP